MLNCHNEYIRITDDKKTAVLMVHGIVGTPRFFDCMIPLIPSEYSIYNILLDGHGRKVEDFCKTSMEKWKKQVRDKLNEIRDRHDEIIIVAHSMGTLLTINSVVENSDKIKKMVLFAVPLKPRLKFITVKTSLKVIFKAVDENNDYEVNSREQYSIEPDWRLWRYVGFAPRYIELLNLAANMRKRVKAINVPCDVFICGNDEMVSLKSIKYFEDNSNFKVHVLKNSSHNKFDKKDFKHVSKIIKKCISHQ